MFEVNFDGEVDEHLIQRCVDKGLLDEDFLQKSIDMELMALGRRITNRPNINKMYDFTFILLNNDHLQTVIPS